MDNRSSEFQAFVNELNGFAGIAEETLNKIEEDKTANKGLFSVFSEKMLTIRGTAMQLELPIIANIAGLGEEIAEKGMTAQTNRQIRKCLGSLWDALTTVKYLLEHVEEETTEEQEILIHRLQSTLKAFGGEREKVSEDEISAMLRARRD